MEVTLNVPSQDQINVSPTVGECGEKYVLTDMLNEIAAKIIRRVEARLPELVKMVTESIL